MFDIHLHITQQTDNCVILSIHFLFRIVLACITAVIVIGGVLVQSISLFAILILCILCASITYHERWRMDMHSIVKRYGFLFFVRTQSWHTADITAVEYQHYSMNTAEKLKGIFTVFTRRYLKYSLIHRTQGYIHIETRRIHGNEQYIMQIPTAIAKILQKDIKETVQ